MINTKAKVIDVTMETNLFTDLDTDASKDGSRLRSARTHERPP